MTADKILALAKQEIGYEETGNNQTKYGAWYGMNGQPWCVMYIMWLFSQAGAADLLPARTASCGALMRAAQKVGQWVTIGFQPGDVVIYDFPKTKYATDHCGIVWQVLGDQTVLVIEGNTSIASDANGGEVMARIRSTALIRGAWRPNWKEMDSVSLNNNIPDSYAEKAVAWAKENRILQGDANGNLNLHQPCTRQHVLVWLWRFAKLLGKA